MSAESWSLAGTALLIGCLHTLMGPDHYVPFVAMSRAGKWSVPKTLWITALCGVGHVASSVLLGLLGIALGIAVSRLEGVEEARGGVAAWLLIAFGLVYLCWGLVVAGRGRSHSHPHCHEDGTVHSHPHHHQGGHLHVHEENDHATNGNALDDQGEIKAKSITPWILFTIFLFGPCEPLIPLLIYPAAEGNMLAVVVVTLLFSLATVLMMTVMVRLLIGGFTLVRFAALDRYSHAIAGCLVLVCGVAIKMGL
jgi:nickel/cobalt exporter